MDMQTFDARVKIDGVIRYVRIDAISVIEAQYGASNIVGVNPTQN